VFTPCTLSILPAKENKNNDRNFQNLCTITEKSAFLYLERVDSVWLHSPSFCGKQGENISYSLIQALSKA
jgi:hypothetical protein